MRVRSRAALALAAVAATMSVTAPTATAVPGCGGFRDAGYGYYYDHCGPTQVKINIDVARRPDQTRCVNPGDNLLWLKVNGPEARGAWYVGLC
ncbi:DUF6355 family natural product biosynthesis protein [Allokutzneria albata]|nr:DUF6355 family natural product biosynthesis protein [Allokutzneria albata]